MSVLNGSESKFTIIESFPSFSRVNLALLNPALSASVANWSETKYGLSDVVTSEVVSNQSQEVIEIAIIRRNVNFKKLNFICFYVCLLQNH